MLSQGIFNVKRRLVYTADEEIGVVKIREVAIRSKNVFL